MLVCKIMWSSLCNSFSFFFCTNLCKHFLSSVLCCWVFNISIYRDFEVWLSSLWNCRFPDCGLSSLHSLTIVTHNTEPEMCSWAKIFVRKARKGHVCPCMLGLSSDDTCLIFTLQSVYRIALTSNDISVATYIYLWFLLPLLPNFSVRVVHSWWRWDADKAIKDHILTFFAFLFVFQFKNTVCTPSLSTYKVRVINFKNLWPLTISSYENSQSIAFDLQYH